MKMTMRIASVTAVLVVAGCKTTEEVRPLTWKEQSSYMAKVRDPRSYGYSIYQTPGGIDYRGGCRLHSNQVAEFPMDATEPLRPVGAVRGAFGLETAVLFDFTASNSWFEFSLARSLGATPISEGKAQLVKISGDDQSGCLSVVPTLRLNQLYVGNPLVYVRLANGPLGSLARGVESPVIKGVVGWDILKKLEQIHLDYAGKRLVILTTAITYDPNPELVVAKIPLVKHAGACVVRGLVDGQPGMILIDPAGDFEVATEGAVSVAAIQLDRDLIFSAPVVSNSPGGTRIGARLLQNYKVTICPKDGLVFFEKPSAVETK